HGDDAASTDPYGRILGTQSAASMPKPASPAPELRGSYGVAPEITPEPRYTAPAPHDQSSHHYGDPGRNHYAGPQMDAPVYQDAGYDGQPTPNGAEGGWNDDAQYLDYGESSPDYDDAESHRRWLRPWHAVAAISLLAIVGIGWGFAHRGGDNGSKEIVTITAPEGPVKVKPTAEIETAAPDEKSAAVLDRKENEPVKQVVTNQEQAVEPTVTPKAVTLGNGPVDAPHEAAPAPAMPPPKKIKTVTVRPDGSRVEDAEALPPAVSRATRAAEPPAQRTATPAAPAPKTAPPKVLVKSKPHPTVAAAPPADAEAAAPADPADAAAAPEPDAAPIASGSWAVQFGAAKSEDEARALVRSVSSRYGAALGGRSPSFRMAQVGGNTVYRVRAGGFSKESASAICNRVKASGGSCFIAGN
ncbi:MAG: SPOR domain-containing protein, partial [Methylocystis sp.]|nr:SPOR domain-containing protein [Methylocystis sp.]